MQHLGYLNFTYSLLDIFLLSADELKFAVEKSQPLLYTGEFLEEQAAEICNYIMNVSYILAMFEFDCGNAAFMLQALH